LAQFSTPTPLKNAPTTSEAQDMRKANHRTL
jgi:hypothetical protein